MAAQTNHGRVNETQLQGKVDHFLFSFSLIKAVFSHSARALSAIKPYAIKGHKHHIKRPPGASFQFLSSLGISKFFM